MRFLGGFFLEEFSGLIIHQDEQGRRSVVGVGNLQAWVDRWIHKSTGKARPLLPAQIHHVCKNKLPLTRELFQESGCRTWRVHFSVGEKCCPALPTWMVHSLRLQTGRSYDIRMRAARETGWHPFQRITDTDLELVEGTLLFVKAEDVETQELSAEFRLCAIKASPWWIFVHEQMALHEHMAHLMTLNTTLTTTVKINSMPITPTKSKHIATTTVRKKK